MEGLSIFFNKFNYIYIIILNIILRKLAKKHNDDTTEQN